jgi:hypothetical protein
MSVLQIICTDGKAVRAEDLNLFKPITPLGCGSCLGDCLLLSPVSSRIAPVGWSRDWEAKYLFLENLEIQPFLEIGSNDDAFFDCRVLDLVLLLLLLGSG